MNLLKLNMNKPLSVKIIASGKKNQCIKIKLYMGCSLSQKCETGLPPQNSL